MSIMSPQEKSEFLTKLDETGEEKVRENLAQGIYGASSKPLVDEWLRKREEIRNQIKSDLESSFQEQELSETKEANRVAREANEFARAANESSKEAIRVARQNKNIALAAFIISSITAIVATIISLCKK